MIDMAVGYLASDWDPRFVKTTDEGKNFKFAAYDMNGVGLGFSNRTVFILLDEDGGPYTAKGLVDMFLKIHEKTASVKRFSDFDEFEGEIILLYRNGMLDEDSCTEAELSEEQLDKLKELYTDVSRYWEPFDEDEYDPDEDLIF